MTPTHSTYINDCFSVRRLTSTADGLLFYCTLHSESNVNWNLIGKGESLIIITFLHTICVSSPPIIIFFVLAFAKAFCIGIVRF